MARSVSKTVTVAGNEETDSILLVGYADVHVSGLSTGTVTLYQKFPKGSTWIPVADGAFTGPVDKIMQTSEHGVLYKLVASGADTGAYMRLGIYLNK